MTQVDAGQCMHTTQLDTATQNKAWNACAEATARPEAPSIPGVLSNGGEVRLVRDLVDNVHHAVGDGLEGGTVDDNLASMAGFCQGHHPVPHLAAVLPTLADLIHLRSVKASLSSPGSNNLAMCEEQLDVEINWWCLLGRYGHG